MHTGHAANIFSVKVKKNEIAMKKLYVKLF